MASPTSNGDHAPPTRSAACVIPPPSLTDGTDWFVPTPGRNGRRLIQVGEHLAADHPLVVAYPSCFVASPEPIDCWPIGVPDQDTRKRQLAQQRRLAASPARKVTPCCARCGAECEQSVIMFDPPTQLGLISELSGLNDYDPGSSAERVAIEARFAAMARAAQAQAAELQRTEAAWRAEHQFCPEGTEPLPEPQIPKHAPLFYRTTAVRGSGIPTIPSIGG